MEDLITAGELAKLARTTKRTILFYDEKGVLKPVKIDEKGYRYYSQRQILDYQMVLLLTTLGVSLKDIKSYLGNRGKLAELFKEKRPQIVKEIQALAFSLKTVDDFLQNLSVNKTMIAPEIKNFVPLHIYYMDTICAYAKIGDYCAELHKMFEGAGKSIVTMAIFEDQGYRPKDCHIKIAAFGRGALKVKKQYKDVIKEMELNPGKVISYKYHGRGEMLSLFWKELEKYCELNKIRIRADVPDFEIYWKVSSNLAEQMFEIFLPIE
jgi:DNA-binding transcriptional MerR regulator